MHERLHEDVAEGAAEDFGEDAVEYLMAGCYGRVTTACPVRPCAPNPGCRVIFG